MASKKASRANGQRARAIALDESHKVAKIQPPNCAGATLRPRVFKLLDRARERSIVWVSAPAGSGKTTLTASYLRARKLPSIWHRIDAGDGDIVSFFHYLSKSALASSTRNTRLPILTPDNVRDIETFATQFFRELFARLRKPAVWVLDNYQDVASDAKVHRVLQLACEQCPGGVNIVVLSRESPPAQLARERALDHLAFLGWEELRFTAEETSVMVRARSKTGQATLANKLHEQTQGWAAGLVLLTELSRASDDRALPAGTANQAIFDYFANEVFQNSDAASREFLLQTAFLRRFSAEQARALTGSPQAEAILDYLTRRNLFTIRHADGAFEYHALFQAFLTMRVAQQFDAERIRQLKQVSVQSLAEHKDVESAIALLQELQDWNGLAQLVRSQAEELALQGRTQTLAARLLAIPEAIREQDPWLLYWLGMSRLSSAGAQARCYFERAFALFESRDDATPLYLTWARIVESYVFEWNDFTPLSAWLDRYATLGANRTPPSSDAETVGVFAYISGLFHARPDSSDLDAYCERAERLCRQERNIDRLFAQTIVLMPYYLWRGDWSKMEGLLQMLAPHVGAPDTRPLGKLYYYVWSSFHASTSGATEASVTAVADGLAFARSAGVHLLDMRILAHGMWWQMCVGDIGAARKLFAQMTPPSQPGQLGAHYDCFASMLLLHEGDIAAAVKKSQSCLRQALHNSLFYAEAVYRVCAAYLAFQADVDGEAALRVIEQVRTVGERARSKFILYLCAFSEAHVRMARNERELGLAALRSALALGKSIGIVTPPWILRSQAASLYALALEENVERDYVRNTIAKTRLPPPVDEFPEHWPWPIRIYTLGRFSVIKDGAPLSFAGRTQQKPMELLRALAAYGNRDVSVHALAQALWPNAEGDAAKRAVETTLHRLRRLIGERTVVRNGNYLSLNANMAWLDVWGLEREFERASPTDFVAQHAQRLLQLYRGPFLHDEDTPWAIVQRERLRAGFLRVAVKIGEQLGAAATEGAGIHGDRIGDDVADWYEQSIAVEPYAETLYMKLMLHHARRKRGTEAITVYRRYYALATSGLHMEPSARMRQEYEKIRHAAA